LPSAGPFPISAQKASVERPISDFVLEETADGQVVISHALDPLLGFEGKYRSEPMSEAEAHAALAANSYSNAFADELYVYFSQQLLGGEETLRLAVEGDYPVCIATRDLDLALVLSEEVSLKASGRQNIFVDRARCASL
jgi:hypothetical protein